MKFTLQKVFTFLCSFCMTYSHAQSVGSIDGVFNVSDLGGASYSIPIKVPDGIGGLQPGLSLNYNSQSANGPLGMGWTIGGISVITRTGNHIYHDKKVKGVDYTSNDRFALDGNRLIATSGSYGGNGSVYHTEVESFKEVTAVGSLGNGPMSFIVKDQNGYTYEYGNTDVARLVATGKTEALAWYLNKVTDLNGNYMTFSYTSSNAVMLPEYIKYNCNSNTGLSFQSYITFSYSLAAAPNFSYVGGSKIPSEIRMNKISAMQNDGGTWRCFRSYTAEYSEDFYSHLVKITEKGANEQETLPSTEFNYGATTIASSMTAKSELKNMSGSSYGQCIGDYNGDGLSDILDFSTLNGGDFKLSLRNADGTYSLAQTGYFDNGFAGIPNQNLIEYNQSNLINFDYNGDGKSDFASFQHYSPSNGIFWQLYQVYQSNGAGLFAVGNIVSHDDPVAANPKYFGHTMPFMGDFDGDGKTEILLLNTLKNSTNFNYIIGEKYNSYTNALGYPAYKARNIGYGFGFDASYIASNESKLLVIDYDGDGKNEILSIWKDNVANVNHAQVWRLNVTFDANNNPVIGSPVFVAVSDGNFPTLAMKLFPGDFNGDGITDLLTENPAPGNNNSMWWIGYGMGNGVFYPMTAPAINTSSVGAGGYLRPLLVADFNGDGKDDIFDYSTFSSSYEPRIHYSKGNNVFTTELLTMTTSEMADGASYYKLGDFNGDGSVDFITRPNYFSVPYECSFHPNETRNLLTKVKDGLGAVTEINYASLPDKTVYSSGASVYNYPYIKKTIPLKVVATIKADNGVNATGNLVSYAYSGLKLNLNGKGILGYDMVQTTDNASKTVSQKNFSLNQAYGLPYLSSTTSKYSNFPASQTMAESSTEYGIYDYGNKRIFPYVTSSSVKNLLTGEIAITTNEYVFSDGQFTIMGKTYSSYNGKPYSITTNKGNGLEITTHSFTYPSAYSPAYIYAKPENITLITIRQNQPAYSRKSSFTYNNTTGWLLTETKDPNTTNAVTTSFWYDTYGNPVRKLTEATGLTGSDERYVYDPSNRYVKEAYNAASPAIKTLSTYSVLTGSKLTETDPDGFMTTFTCDGFGRLKTQSDNNGKSATISYGWGGITPASAIPDGNAAYYTGSLSNTGTAVYTVYDRLGRKIKSSRKNFQNQWIHTLSNYNTLGQISSVSKPFSGMSCQLISNSYDIYGRPVKTEAPEGNTLTSYALSGGYYTITQTQPSGQQTKVKTDASGRKIEVTDPTGNTLSYVYHSNGGEKTVTSSGTTLQTYGYDDFGRLKERTDPNYGTELTNYNAYGQVTKTTDPKGNAYTFIYDALGRLTKKTGPEGAYNYEYNNNAGWSNVGGFACGKLIKLSGPEGAISYDYFKGDQVRAVTYDDYQGDPSYAPVEITEYDSYGRLFTRQYLSGAKVTYIYGAPNGELSHIKDFYTDVTLYEKIAENDLGQTTAYSQGLWGQGINTVNTYDGYGYLTGQKTTNTSGTLLRHYQYSFDPATGNLLQRKNVKNNLEENFAFDNLNRLTDITYPVALGLPNIHTGFQSNGNISQKTDAGDFSYDQANRLSKIEHFQNIPTATQTVEYTPFNKVSRIVEGVTEVRFRYWPNGERSSMTTYKSGQLEQTKIYGPDVEFAANEGGGTQEWTYVKAPEGNVVALIAPDAGAFFRDLFVLTDHLGSFTHVINDNYEVADEKSYDAWGRLRNPLSWQAYTSNTGSNPNLLFYLQGWDSRGYTGHEHLPAFGIINMNGRLYDPVMGRMFSPDPYIIGADNLQGYNRYTYGLNNPLSYTDPDGENPIFVAMGIGAAIGAYMGGNMANNNFNPLSWNYSSGRTWGYMLGGAIAGGLSGGAGGAISASGIPFANTLGIAAGSLINSVGTNIYTGGQTGIYISMGLASFNFSTGNFGYLGKPGNSFMENLGYGFGALANLQDMVAGMNGVTAEYRAESEGVQHARLKGDNFDISVSHERVPLSVYKYNTLSTDPNYSSLLENLDYARYWMSHIKKGVYYRGTGNGLSLDIFNVNGKWLKAMSDRLGNGSAQGEGLWGIGRLKYGTSMFGCQSHVAHALWGVGVPTLPINVMPSILYGQLWLRQAGFYAAPILVNH